jgi:hypothetical protein
VRWETEGQWGREVACFCWRCPKPGVALLSLVSHTPVFIAAVSTSPFHQALRAIALSLSLFFSPVTTLTRSFAPRYFWFIFLLKNVVSRFLLRCGVVRAYCLEIWA